MKEILRNPDKMYILYEEEGECYVLSAMSGGVGMYEVKVRLNSDEAARFEAEGEEFIARFAYDVGKQTSKFQDRIVL